MAEILLFMAAPIRNEAGTVKYIVGLQIPLDLINTITARDVPYGQSSPILGETGEAYLVGSEDGFLRSPIAKAPEDWSVRNSLPSPNVDDLSGGRAAAVDGMQAFLADEKKCFSEFTGVHGKEVRAAFAQLDFLGQPWILVAEQDSEEATATFSVIDTLIMVGVIVVLIASAVFALAIGKESNRSIICHVASGLDSKPEAISINLLPFKAQMKLVSLASRLTICSESCAQTRPKLIAVYRTLNSKAKSTVS